MAELGSISPRARNRMINELKERGISNPTVISALQYVKRHEFIDEAFRHKSYMNSAIPIGNNQTISQPYIVAIMTEALLKAQIPVRRVLEIGTGSGYQAAILARIVAQVYSVERIETLIPKAKAALGANNVSNIYIKHSDGYAGWLDQAPFDGVMVTAAAEGVPRILYEQLNMGGRIIIPINSDKGGQNLVAVDKTPEGEQYSIIEAVRFVPMLHGTT
jgi:protein-L-isoaspartate(D-aspartate) O-methyltransferase